MVFQSVVGNQQFGFCCAVDTVQSHASGLLQSLDCHAESSCIHCNHNREDLDVELTVECRLTVESI